MRCRRSLLSTMLMTLLTTSPLAAAPLSILWDDSHDLDGDEIIGDTANYSAFAAQVVAAGHTITEHNDDMGPLDATALAGYEALMIFDAEESLTLESTAIHAFVAAGGKLLIAGEFPASFARISHNTLLAPYGVSFSALTLADPFNTNPALDLSVWEPDPLTTGLTVVDFHSSGTLLLDATIPGNKKLGSMTPSGHVGFASGAGGAILVLTDADLFSNNLLSPGDQEAKLLANILGHFTPAGPPPPIEVTIDIKPDSTANPVNPKSNGVVPVAILTTSVEDGDDAIDFDPWDAIDVTTLAFGPGSAAPDQEPYAEDVDFDGDLDMLLYFRTTDTGVQCGDTELALSALTFDEDTVIGTDSITTPGCKGDE